MNNITNLEGALRVFDEKFDHPIYKCTDASDTRFRFLLERIDLDIKDFITQVWQASRSQAIEELKATRHTGTTCSCEGFGCSYNQSVENILTKLSELKTKE